MDEEREGTRPTKRRRTRVIYEDDDEDVVLEDNEPIYEDDDEYDDDAFDGRREPREEFEEEDEEEDGEEDEYLDEDDRRHQRRGAAAADKDEPQDDEHVDGIGPNPSLTELLGISVRQAAAARAEQVKQTKLLMKLLARGATPAGASSRARPDRTGPRRRAPAPRPSSLPLDGSTRRFGPGWRKLVQAAILAKWFKVVGAQVLLLPYQTAAPIAMRAGNLDPTNLDERDAFDLQYKSETSAVGSKGKALLSSIFVEQLITLYQLPPIVDAGVAHPPGMIVHKPAFKALREPPPGFSPADLRYKRMSAWHAALNASNELMAFETPQSRKLFTTDFFSRVLAKGLLPEAACHWNLGSFAYFCLFADARLTIKQSTAGHAVYGNLKDGADAMIEVERICDWLMDPVACPTTFPILLTIRQQNPLYGNVPAAAA